MTVSSGVIAALVAPLLEAVGFLEWGIHWTNRGGSAFALNLLKCNLAGFCFIIMTTHSNNLLYMKYTVESSMYESNPWRLNDHDTDHSIIAIQQDKAMLIDPTSPDARIMEHTEFALLQEPIDLNPPLQNTQHIIPRFEQETNHLRYEQLNERNPNNSDNGRKLRSLFNDKVYSPPLPNYPQLAKGLPKDYDFPFRGKTNKIPYIILSSFLGIIIGDSCELEALRLVGARRVLVVDTIKPFFTAILGNLLLNEPIYLAAFIGMIFTATGVYFVLMASIKRLETVKDDRRKGSIKRRGSQSELDNLLDGIADNLLTGKNNYEENNSEIANILDDSKENQILMVGIRKRPLSRHDLCTEYEDAITSDEKEADNLVLLLEDGRGIMNTTICCGGSPQRSGSWGSNTSGGSWGNLSWNSDETFGSEEDMYAMNLENANMGEDFFDGTKAATMNHVQEEMQRDVFVAMPIPKDKDQIQPPINLRKEFIKPALKKSSFGVGLNKSSTSLVSKNNNSFKQEHEANFHLQRKYRNVSHNNINSVYSNPLDKGTITTSMQQDSLKNNMYGSESKSLATNINKGTFSTLNINSSGNNIYRNNSKRHNFPRSSSSGSVSTFETECGPPRDIYNRKIKETTLERKIRLRTGYTLSTINVLLDAYGAYLIKKHGTDMTTWEINLCRMVFAGIFMAFISILMRYLNHRKILRDAGRRMKDGIDQPSHTREGDVAWYRLPSLSVYSWIVVSIGVLFVTFLCPALTNYALFEIPLSLTVTLVSLTPLYIVPLSWIRKGEIPTKQGCIGVCLSVVGVIILCVWGLDAQIVD